MTNKERSIYLKTIKELQAIVDQANDSIKRIRALLHEEKEPEFKALLAKGLTKVDKEE